MVVLVICLLSVLISIFWYNRGYTDGKNAMEPQVFDMLSRTEKAVEEAEDCKLRMIHESDLRSGYLLQCLEDMYGKDSKEYNNFKTSLQNLKDAEFEYFKGKGENYFKKNT